MPGAQVFYGACTYLHPYVDDEDDDRGLRSARDGRLDGSSAAGGGGQHRRRRDRERSRSAQKTDTACLLACLVLYRGEGTTERAERDDAERDEGERT